jgi:dihydrofolate reductase
MGKLILSIMSSIDGYMEGPNKELDWHVWNGEMEKHMFNFLNHEVDTILLGRKSYELFAAYWPSSKESIAPAMNSLKKIVFSKTLQTTEWNNTTIIGDDIQSEITRLKQRGKKDLVLFGGVEITASLIKLNLIDEYQVIINPVVLGQGRPTFALEEKLNFKLVDLKRFNCGNVIHYYHLVKGSTN